MNFPATINDGRMQSVHGQYHNLLIIPFAVGGLIKVELVVMSGEVITISGNGISHVFKEEPVFVEVCPDT